MAVTQQKQRRDDGGKAEGGGQLRRARREQLSEGTRPPCVANMCVPVPPFSLAPSAAGGRGGSSMSQSSLRAQQPCTALALHFFSHGFETEKRQGRHSREGVRRVPGVDAHLGSSQWRAQVRRLS